MSLTNLKSFQALQKHFDETKNAQMMDLFASDEKRAADMTVALDDFVLDYSKNRVSRQTLELLVQLANECNVAQMRDKMFAGDKINFTENRAVLHTALRNRSDKPVFVTAKM